jgi:hypothetical protein
MSTNSKKITLFLSMGTFLLLSIYFLAQYITGQTQENSTTPPPLKSASIESCATASNLASCASALLKPIIEKEGITPAKNQLIEAVKNSKSFLPQCHTILHQVGADAWQLHREKAFLKDIYDCDFAYYHGMFPQSAKDLGLEQFNALAQPFCNSITTPAMLSSCYHGLGHAMRYAGETMANSSKACSKAPTTDYSDDCMRGVVMEEYNLDQPSPEKKTGNLLANCLTLTDTHSYMCIFDTIRMDLATFPEKTNAVSTLCKENIYNDKWCNRGLGAGIAQSIMLPEDTAKSIQKINSLCRQKSECASAYGMTLVMTTRSEENSLKTCSLLSPELVAPCTTAAKTQAIAQSGQGGFALDAEKSSTTR